MASPDPFNVYSNQVEHSLFLSSFFFKLFTIYMPLNAAI